MRDDDDDVIHSASMISSTYENEKSANYDFDDEDNRQSVHSQETFSINEYRMDSLEQQELSAVSASCEPQAETKENTHSFEEKDSALEQDDDNSEELTSFSDQNKIEEDTKLEFISSAGYYGSFNASVNLNNQGFNKLFLNDVDNDNPDSATGTE